MRTVQLNGGEISSQQALHRSLAVQLAFPSWYGNNLDALYDLLSTERAGVRIVIRDQEALERCLGEYWTRTLAVFSDVAEETGRLTVEYPDRPILTLP